MHPSLYRVVKPLLETCPEHFFLVFHPSYNRTGKLSPGKAKALFQYHSSQRKREWNITVAVISTQTYAHDYFNCKRMAASLVLRRKEIPFSPDCLQAWVHVSKAPQHFQKSGHTCCDGQLVYPTTFAKRWSDSYGWRGHPCSQEASSRGFRCHC